MESGYPSRTRASARLYARSKKVFAGGVNHNARYFEPYPLFLKKAKGRYVWDEDGNRYADYWMGHLALLLGHSPGVVVDALRAQVPRGTHFGTGSRLSVELGEEVHESVPCAELMRFCNTGAEATMYLVRLARGFTGRRTIIKMAGGWHGYNTELNKAVHSPFDRPEGAGILTEEQEHVVSVRFNDLEKAEEAARRAEGDVSAIFLEPVLGAGGCIPADKDYLRGLRELADRSGALLAFDEIITGFRLELGGAQEAYGVTPDLATFGKVLGGGLPVGLVCGRKDVVSRADPSRHEGFVSIGGGTFSENPLTMAAGLATLKYLRRNKRTVYPALNRLGEEARNRLDRAFSEAGVQGKTTGAGSMFMPHFGRPPYGAAASAASESHAKRFSLGLIERGIFVLPGHLCGLSTCHSGRDIGELGKAAEETLRSLS